MRALGEGNLPTIRRANQRFLPEGRPLLLDGRRKTNRARQRSPIAHAVCPHGSSYPQAVRPNRHSHATTRREILPVILRSEGCWQGLPIHPAFEAYCHCRLAEDLSPIPNVRYRKPLATGVQSYPASWSIAPPTGRVCRLGRGKPTPIPPALVLSSAEPSVGFIPASVSGGWWYGPVCGCGVASGVGTVGAACFGTSHCDRPVLSCTK
jgi:hypothetical protein